MRSHKQAHSLHRRIANITAVFLIITGAVGLSVEILHLFGFEEYVVRNKDAAVLLALLALEESGWAIG